MAETRQQFLQGLATMATVGEAGARWAAVGIQNKAAEREREVRRNQAAATTRREADRLAARVRADRERMAASLDGDWLVNKATFAEAAAVWRTATIHASSDPVAKRAVEFAEQRLRQFRPDLIAAYERHRQEEHRFLRPCVPPRGRCGNAMLDQATVNMRLARTVAHPTGRGSCPTARPRCHRVAVRWSTNSTPRSGRKR
ncbi:hypothetical protein [Micromonospora zamorensis]|uniref:hypothetical protein n=1 Tax=Micromonospora zamorensis TaxID=709883 RepID=UPI0033A6F801